MGHPQTTGARDEIKERVSEMRAVCAAGAQGTCVRVGCEKPEGGPNSLPAACSPPCRTEARRRLRKTVGSQTGF